MEEESIYNLIPEQYVPPPKQTLYRSKFPGATSANKKPSASMGQPHTVVDAKQFLRKGTASVATVCPCRRLSVLATAPRADRRFPSASVESLSRETPATVQWLCRARQCDAGPVSRLARPWCGGCPVCR